MPPKEYAPLIDDIKVVATWVGRAALRAWHRVWGFLKFHLYAKRLARVEMGIYEAARKRANLKRRRS